MTGEITLRGRVLAIGGLKEKAVAAHRNAVRHVLIPHQNARDLEELPAEVQGGGHVPSGADDGRSARARARRAPVSTPTRPTIAPRLVRIDRAGATNRSSSDRSSSSAGWRPPAGGVREPTLPEVAFAGRSNVGKSSLLNRLVHRKKFARVSNTPGRTREMNFFKVNDSFVLVDLPGYGYARVSKERQRRVAAAHRGLPAREPGAARDRAAARRAARSHRRRPADARLPRRARRPDDRRADEDRQAHSRRNAKSARRSGPRSWGSTTDQVIPFSAVTGEGRDELAEAVEALLEQPSWRAES